MKVRCRFCKAEIDLNEDSVEARVAGTDPHQQLRRHLVTHPLQIARHVREGALPWLIDTLAFDCVDDPGRYKRHQQALFEASRDHLEV